MKNVLKASILALSFLVTGMLSVDSAYGQTIQRTTETKRVGPTITSTPVPATTFIWSWPSWDFSQPRIQQQLPYRTYWTNPNPNRIFPRITEQAIADFLRKK